MFCRLRRLACGIARHFLVEHRGLPVLDIRCDNSNELFLRHLCTQPAGMNHLLCTTGVWLLPATVFIRSRKNIFSGDSKEGAKCVLAIGLAGQQKILSQ